MNNDVNMNNVMMLWGEFNMLMDKCNYKSKEQYSPIKKLTWYQSWAKENSWRSPPWRHI